MKKTTLQIGLCLFILCGTSRCSKPVEKEQPPVNLEQTVEQILEHWKAPGAVLTIVKEDSILFNKGFGSTRVEGGVPVTRKTMATVASVTKTINSVVFALLAEDSLVTWDDPVVQHIPEFYFVDDYRTRHTTIRDLITHRSGLPAIMADFWTIEYTMKDLLRDLPDAKPQIGFRERIDYCQVGIALTGEIVKRVTGFTWPEYVKSRIISPLGMNNTFMGATEFKRVYPDPTAVTNLMGRAEWDEDQLVDGQWRASNDLYTPPAGMITTGEDMAKYMIFLLNRGIADGKHLLSNTSIKNLFTPQLVDESWSKSMIRPGMKILTYCLGWYAHEYESTGIVEHPGGGFGSSVIALLPEEQVGVFVSSNANFGLESLRMVGAIKLTAIDYALGLERKDWISMFSQQVSD